MSHKIIVALWLLSITAPHPGRADEPSGATESPAVSEPWYVHGRMTEASGALFTGYSNCLTGLTERYGAAVPLSLQAYFWPGRWGIGFDIKRWMSAGYDTLTIPSELSEDGQRYTVNTNESRGLLGMGIGWSLYRNRHLFIAARFGMGYSYFRRNIAEKEEVRGLYNEYHRKRAGIYGSQEIAMSLLGQLRPKYMLGAQLSVGLVESYSWNRDGIQPDLGTEDSRKYGIELWPQAIVSLVFIESEKPIRSGDISPVEARIALRDYMSNNAFRQSSLGFAMVYPAGNIAARQPPGVGFSVMQESTRFRFGIIGAEYIMSFGLRDSMAVILPANHPDNPHPYDWRMFALPMMVTVGTVYAPFIWYGENSRISLGVRLGVIRHSIMREKKVVDRDGNTHEFGDHEYARMGPILGERLELLYFPTWRHLNSIALNATFTFMQSYTWTVDEIQWDSGQKDSEKLGIEFWPVISLGMSMLY